MSLSLPALNDLAGWLPGGWMGAETGDLHSRRVALLKRLLPATGLALLLLITMWPKLAPLWDRMRIGFPAIDLREAGELRMMKPRYAGVDRTGRPFVVTAASGRQVPDRQDLMSLEAPRAEVKTHGGADVLLTGATGIYQSQVQGLDLFGDVTIVHQNGTRFVTDTAHADVAHNTAEGSDPVEGHGPSGDVKAQGFRILNKGDTIIFTGHADMLLKGAKPAVEKTAPAALPAEVVASAAHAEKEAQPLLTTTQPAAPRHAVTPRHAAASSRPTRQAGKPPHHSTATAKKS
jgi:lipopolysaccharide export system protein LptC